MRFGYRAKDGIIETTIKTIDESHTLIILNYNGHQINSKMILKSFFTEKSHRKFCTENPVYFPSLKPSPNRTKPSLPSLYHTESTPIKNFLYTTMLKYSIAFFVAFILPVMICAGLYSIRNEHYAVTNVCNATFYPNLCVKETK